jgi:UDP-N-acetylmuramoylalanine--D-glutamate ligase
VSFDWAGKRAVVLGLARQGKAVARYLSEQGAQVVVSDLKRAESVIKEREELADLPIEFVLGGHPDSLVEGTDLLCLSGGVPADLPLAQQARRRGIRITNDAQLFLEACPSRTVGITGSAGKTTTTALAGEMIERHLQGSGRKAWTGGNIGWSPLASLHAMKGEDIVVLELSSFQLEVMTRSPLVAAVLNVTPNHLDRHRTMEAYTAAKANILTHQSASDIAILGWEDPGAWALRDCVRGRVLAFGIERAPDVDGVYVSRDALVAHQSGQETRLCPVEAVTLRGRHNLQNVAAACAVAWAVDVSPQAIESAVRDFRGVAHRLEFVRRVRGVDWYNDSIATAPERAMAAIRAFEEPLVLLAGGRDKDLPWEAFAELVCRRVERLILFGEAAPKIASAVGKVERCQGRLRPVVCASLEEAVQAAAGTARPGDVVLLSPGGTSFDAFTDFEARGQRFRELVISL